MELLYNFIYKYITLYNYNKDKCFNLQFLNQNESRLFASLTQMRKTVTYTEIEISLASEIFWCRKVYLYLGMRRHFLTYMFGFFLMLVGCTYIPTM